MTRDDTGERRAGPRASVPAGLVAPRGRNACRHIELCHWVVRIRARRMCWVGAIRMREGLGVEAAAALRVSPLDGSPDGGPPQYSLITSRNVVRFPMNRTQRHRARQRTPNSRRMIPRFSITSLPVITPHIARTGHSNRRANGNAGRVALRGLPGNRRVRRKASVERSGEDPEIQETVVDQRAWTEDVPAARLTAISHRKHQ